MKDRPYLLHVLLLSELFVLSAAVLLTRTFAPSVILPGPGIPLLVLLTAVPLAAEQYLGVPTDRDWLGSVLLAVAAFAMGAFALGAPILRTAVLGGTVFAVTAVVYPSMGSRMKSGPAAKAAPAVNALLLVLAAQAMQGIC